MYDLIDVCHYGISTSLGLFYFKSRSLYVYIDCLFFLFIYLFIYLFPIIYQVFLSDADNGYTVISFQEIISMMIKS